MADAAASPPPPPSIDPRSGYRAATGTYYSIRPPLPLHALPSCTGPLSFTSYALSLLPSPLPPHPAIISSSSSSSISFPVLLNQIHTLSSSLRSRGVSKGDVVLILSHNTPHLPVLYLSLLSLGAVLSPANPSSTPSEISHLCRLSSPSLAFAASSASHKLPSHLPAILLDSLLFQTLIGQNRIHNFISTLTDPVHVSQSDPAVILYSSGTTGKMKGVELTHGNLIAQVAPAVAAAAARGILPGTVVMVAVPMFHVFGFVQCLKAMAAGETLVVMAERFDARRVLRDVARFGVTHLAVVPPAVMAVVDAREEEGESVDVSSLEAVLTGGAPIAVELIRRFVAKFPMSLVSQGYGLTESTAGVSRPIGPEESRHFGSAGRLSQGCEAKIVDVDTGIVLPPSMRGEIWLRGPTIMKGYICDQEATSAVLNSEGWLKTGDLGYIDEDGFLFVVDRLKELIKYKGYQVPPAELEHLLQAHPNIIEAAVIPYPDKFAGEVPMAFVVRQPCSCLTESEVMDFVAKQVAPYKKIHRVCFINSIPKNATGKILRKDLVRLATTKLCSRI